ncbi:MAG: NAD(P)-dependent oxidoreductase, partial [Lysobacterales bacterium]
MSKLMGTFWVGLLLAVAGAGCAVDGGQGQAQSSRVLVFGGTGRLGSEITKTLLSNGHAVTVFARPQSDRQRLQGLDVAFVVGDVLQADQVNDAIGAVQPAVVVDALGRGSSPVEFYADSARHIASASAQHKVRQIILHGSVGAGDSVSLLGPSLSARNQRLYGAKSAGEKAVIES